MKMNKVFAGLLALACAGASACAAPSDEDEAIGQQASSVQGGQLELGFPAVGYVHDEEFTVGPCTGTLVSPSWVLTAKHCVGTTPDWDPRFGTGTNQQNLVDRLISPTQTLLHPTADIALLKLFTPITSIDSMRLSTNPSPKVGEVCKLVGFGFHGPPPNPTSGTKRSDTESIVSVTSSSIVTKFLTGIGDHVDSGGPLFCADGGIVAVAEEKVVNVPWPQHKSLRYAKVDNWVRRNIRRAGDITGDGRGDIAITSAVALPSIPVASSKGDGTFATTAFLNVDFSTFAQQVGAVPVSGDFNGDGLADIALTGGTQWKTIPVAFSNGDGTFKVTNLNVTDFPIYAQQAGAKPVAGDFDGDGLSDIALTGGIGWNSIPVALSKGNGTFLVKNLVSLTFPAVAQQAGATPMSGDFDGDGRGDIALVGGAGWNTIPIARSLGDGTFSFINKVVASIPLFSTQLGAKPVTGDFDGDGKTDIALTCGTNWNTIPLARSIGDGTFTVTNLVSATFASLAQDVEAQPVAGDFNADGRTDIALVGGLTTKSVPVAFANANGTFTVTNKPDLVFPSLAAMLGARPVGAN